MSDLFFFKDDYLIQRTKAALWKAPKQPRFQDQFEIVYTDLPVELASYEELASIVGSACVFDVECYLNYFMVAFKFLEIGKCLVFEHNTYTDDYFDVRQLAWVMEHFCLIGYNSKVYDIPMLQLALTNATCSELYAASGKIIYDDIRVYDFQKKYKLRDPLYNHMDLIEVAPLRGSLKLYAGRLQTRRMQDLPVNPTKPLDEGEVIQVRTYCLNDLDNTELLFKELLPALKLRDEMSKEYKVDLRSKSDAQIAEAVISSELYRVNGIKCERAQISSGRTYRYRLPEFIRYRTPILRNMLEVVTKADFVVDAQGYIDMPQEIGDLKLSVGGCVYRMGIGGLHSSEKTVVHKADEDTLLIDRDVVSYYPSIILNQGLYPSHLGRAFLKVYRTIVERRIAAKNSGNKIVADSLKITINGFFGKLGSKWSVLYAPDLMIQVTVTGQLCLLMLIEMIEDLGVPVVSANTDGVVIKCPKSRYQAVQERITWWEGLTGFQTEESRYKAVYSRDVNNYVAHKDDGHCKVKGCYGERGSAGNSVLSKNPENLICNDAVLALIETGTPIEETIKGCKDIRRFVTIRNVTGGARKSDKYLGKVIRWYYSTEMKGEINRMSTGDKVPNTDGARPLMELPLELPSDIDYQRYINVAQSILYDISYAVEPAKQICLGELFS